MSIEGNVSCIMCVITGFMDRSLQSSAEELSAIANRMSDSLSHRGPDDSGLFADSEFGIALGHRRLSILDLSEQGRQPMISADGRYVLVYNEEIYYVHGKLNRHYPLWNVLMFQAWLQEQR